ncbi:di-heme oxidoredictase family protein [Rhizobium leguminosarum]|uniref:di-heme oxidoredictase family protein n=1 Tax=Rhizobium leguminosarum TaxID=384 RepID=UPI00103D419D|nr:di-heme oxidoredictase family protein [Rhizobium leguminosarum]TBZ73811.1 hypothetical protein E0H61_28285 [Rhizobium leguminosarum bv. viciae]
MKASTRAFWVLVCIISIFYCASRGIAQENWIDEIELAGSRTVYSFGTTPYSQSAPNLTLDERKIFSIGSMQFNLDRRRPPMNAPVDPLTPANASINAASCASCHSGDGRGRTHKIDFRSSGFSIVPHPLQAQGAFREPARDADYAKFEDLHWKLKKRIILSAEIAVELVAPVAVVDGREEAVDLRNAPALHGLGLLEAIGASEIELGAARRKFAKFGILGVVPRAREGGLQGTEKVGRFGWRGTAGSLADQVAAALQSELGITKPAMGNVAEYEMLLEALATYVRFLAVPARDPSAAKANRNGGEIFRRVGCTMCHRPSWQLGDNLSIPPDLRGERIYPFTDMLLHDMGKDLRTVEGDSQTGFWRTSALWGIGLQHRVSAGAGYLHDGRARNLVEAVLWHAGEASYSVDRYKELTDDDRERLLKFVSSL